MLLFIAVIIQRIRKNVCLRSQVMEFWLLLFACLRMVGVLNLDTGLYYAPSA
jgi:hypothetical protein